VFGEEEMEDGLSVYAGIGSRQTPDHVLTMMSTLGSYLAGLGWTLRTGGAQGADQAFQRGAASARGDIELYLPWDSFEVDVLVPLLTPETVILPEPTHEAWVLASEHHPIWERLKQGAQKLHSRNCHQVLGRDLDKPVDALICWTPDGSVDGAGWKTGGTGMALRIARANGSPLVINLAIEQHFNYALSLLI
jgi:hypothetical protein